MRTTITREAVQSLIQELQDASQQYYLEGTNSPLTDAEFDAKQTYLMTFVNQFPDLFESGTIGARILEGEPLLGAVPTRPNTEPVVHHVPMLSLAKAKTRTELDARIRRIREAGETTFHLQAKIDGIALSAHYNNGHIVLLATRGDGTTGENISYLLNTEKLYITGLPHTTSIKQEFEVRGEIFFTQEQFHKANTARINTGNAPFENSRNAASGIIKKAGYGLPHEVHLTFAAYSTVVNGSLAGVDILAEDTNFITVNQLTTKEAPAIQFTDLHTNEEIYNTIDTFGEIRDTLSFPTDGIVLKPHHESIMHNRMGSTSHHPVSQIAWKYPAEQGTTTVRSINITVGKTGRITPVATFDPIKLDGSTVSQASLHNFHLIAQKDIRVGSTVIVEKANEIIPQIVAVINQSLNSEPVETPTICPVCNKQLEHPGNIWPPKTLLCPNNACASRDFSALKAAVGRTVLDIDRLSEATLAYLHETGKINSIADLYYLTEDDLANAEMGTTSTGNIRKLGRKTAAHIMKHIEQSRHLPLTRILPALAIPTLGNRTAKILVNHYPTLEALQQASTEELENIPGLGTVKAHSIHQGLKDRQPILEAMAAGGVTFGQTETTIETTDEDTNYNTNMSKIDLNGLAFSISGPVPEPFPNRNSLITYIESHGGAFHSTPKANTTHMIANPNGTSSKIQKAHNLGISFISPREFTTQYTQ